MDNVNAVVVLWQRLEGALVFALALFLYAQTGADLPLWLAVLAFFAPDFSFIAYAFGQRLGAWGYNIVHIYGFGALVFILGALLSAPILSALGALWLAHTGFDRLLGYGLKSETSFGLTHLGRIGRKA